MPTINAAPRANILPLTVYDGAVVSNAITREARRGAADAVLCTSVVGVGASINAMVAALIPPPQNAVPKLISQVAFGIVIGGIIWCVKTQLPVLRQPPTNANQRWYQGAMAAGSIAGVAALGTGITGSFMTDKTVVGALFGVSLGLTFLCIGATLHARHRADYT